MSTSKSNSVKRKYNTPAMPNKVIINEHSYSEVSNCAHMEEMENVVLWHLPNSPLASPAPKKSNINELHQLQANTISALTIQINLRADKLER